MTKPPQTPSSSDVDSKLPPTDHCDESSSSKSLFRWSRILFVLHLLLHLLLILPSFLKPPHTIYIPTSARLTEMIIGYKILHHTLRKESQLKYLHWLRKATLKGPKGPLKNVMTTIYRTSEARIQEFDELLQYRFPPINIREAPPSKMGDSIQWEVESSSKAELIPLPFRSSSPSDWGVRFLLIQAQATRMVVALSTSLKKFETNPDRLEWLTTLETEYELIRERIVELVGNKLVEGVVAVW